MKKLLFKLSFYFDFFIGYLMTKPTPERLMGYHTYMFRRYGTMYATKEDYEEHMELLEAWMERP